LEQDSEDAIAAAVHGLQHGVLASVFYAHVMGFYLRDWAPIHSWMDLFYGHKNIQKSIDPLQCKNIAWPLTV